MACGSAAVPVPAGGRASPFARAVPELPGTGTGTGTGTGQTVANASVGISIGLLSPLERIFDFAITSGSTVLAK